MGSFWMLDFYIFFAGLCEVMEHFQPLQIFPPPSKLPHILDKNNPLILYLSFLKHIRPKFWSVTSSHLYWYDLNTLVFYTCCKNQFFPIWLSGNNCWTRFQEWVSYMSWHLLLWFLKHVFHMAIQTWGATRGASRDFFCIGISANIFFVQPTQGQNLSFSKKHNTNCVLAANFPI